MVGAHRYLPTGYVGRGDLLGHGLGRQDAKDHRRGDQNAIGESGGREHFDASLHDLSPNELALDRQAMAVVNAADVLPKNGGMPLSCLGVGPGVKHASRLTSNFTANARKRGHI